MHLVYLSVTWPRLIPVVGKTGWTFPNNGQFMSVISTQAFNSFNRSRFPQFLLSVHNFVYRLMSLPALTKAHVPKEYCSLKVKNFSPGN